MQIKIHQEGWIYFIVSSILTIIFFAFFPFIGVFFLVLSAYIFYFFRDPIRAIPTEDVIVSPADGLITYIGKSNAPKECNTKNQFLKISIFLNIFNVHVNRTPIAGIIKNIVYVPGKFINATLEKSSSDNERNIITIEKENKDIVIVSQIAGLIARRIVCDLKTNEQIIKGNRFGIIKFGSRVDLYLPSNYTPLVSVGQNVIGGETIISNPNNISKITNTSRI